MTPMGSVCMSEPERRSIRGIDRPANAQAGVVDAVLVVVEAGIGEPHLAGVLVGAHIARAGIAVLVIGQRRGAHASRVGARDDRTALVGVQE